jgi:hypothetical protein
MLSFFYNEITYNLCQIVERTMPLSVLSKLRHNDSNTLITHTPQNKPSLLRVSFIKVH